VTTTPTVPPPTVPAPKVQVPKAPLPSGPFARWLAHPGATEGRLAHRLAHTLAALAHFWPLVALAAVVAAGWWLVAAAARAWQGRHGRWVAIAPPAEPDPAGGTALWRMLAPLLAARRSLTGVRPPVAFECHAGPGGLRIGLWVSKTLPLDSVAGAVESAWPGARANLAAPPALPAGARVSGGRARPAVSDWLPLGTEHGGGDPLRGVLGALAGSEGGTVLFQVLARPAPGRLVARARRAAWARRRGQPTTRAGRALDLLHHHAGATALGGAPDPLALADVRDITAKVTAAPHWQVGVRYALAGPPGPRRQARRWRRAKAREITAGLGLYAGRNHLVARRLARGGRRVACRQLRSGFFCSLPELAALAHLPAEPAGYGLPAAPARHVAPPAEVAHD
jgi:hypothetical protein